MMKRTLTACLLALALATSVASASLATAVTFDELVDRSAAAAVVVPIEQRCVWEGRAIITYTRVHVAEPLAGSATAGQSLWIATRGGIVGTVGQVVDGEPTLKVDEPALVFLREDAPDTRRLETARSLKVTGRAQGFFSLSRRSSVAFSEDARLSASRGHGLLVRPRVRVPQAVGPLAHEVLHARALSEARALIVAAWARRHGAR